MEEKTTIPSAGEGVDPETFRRVWQRVMPDQTDSPLEVEDAPAAVPDTARPAVPTQTGEPGEGACPRFRSAPRRAARRGRAPPASVRGRRPSAWGRARPGRPPGWRS